MNVKGLKITDIMDIDLDAFNRLTESELRHLTSRLVSAGNKRIRRLKAKDINSPALQGLGREMAFSTKLPKGTSRQQRVNKLRAEFSRARSFLTSETSTVSGYKAFAERTKDRIASELGMDSKTLGEKLDLNRLFDILHKAQEKGIISSYRGSQGSIQARAIIADFLVEDPNMDEEELMARLEREADRMYEERELIDDETDDFDL